MTMRVALACDWFLKYSAAQAAGHARQGAEVLLLCRDHPFEFGGDVQELRATIDVARAAGVRVLEMPGRPWDPAAIPELRRIRTEIARFRPSVVHVHDRVDPRAFALLPRAPAVLTIHDLAPHPGQPVSRLAPKRLLLEGSRGAWRRRARAIVVHSERLRNDLYLRRGQTCAVIPHGLWVRDEPLSPPATPTVGFFGRLAPYKGLDVLARAMPRVWERRPEVLLRVAGTGETDLPLTDPRVKFERSYLPESEVETFFRDTSLAVLPYTEASQTGAGSLAVGYGIPVLVSRLGGLPDLALDETYVVAAGDDASLADAIVRHVDDTVQVRARILAEVAGPRSWDACAVLSIHLYEELSRAR
jgi:glycosyltransferase involved in cell wall biosynthesis